MNSYTLTICLNNYPHMFNYTINILYNINNYTSNIDKLDYDVCIYEVKTVLKLTTVYFKILTRHMLGYSKHSVFIVHDLLTPPYWNAVMCIN